ncbi:MAG: DUF4399 domain-containing protein [Gemmatimonadota bacterium]|nr:MAG: DUF4399 domain-containing protein [Gemmatimonadota bacterium]
MTRPLLICFTLLALSACASEPAVDVRILTPEEGALLSGDSVVVTLSATGIDIVPADGLATPGRAHHHLLLDAPLPAAGSPVPVDQPGVVHLGTGDSTLTLTNVTPGEHTLIAVLALGNHVPLDPWAVDTVRFALAPPEE